MAAFDRGGGCRHDGALAPVGDGERAVGDVAAEAGRRGDELLVGAGDKLPNNNDRFSKSQKLTQWKQAQRRGASIKG
ncbi:MAG TPA: hypothetical protein VGH54_25085 [Mycobacterium sp.]|uniref:hypothetical protein n=1 Tax=Mycobacterium sp. TaxID=1785 RepID=UPI002F3ED2A1